MDQVSRRSALAEQSDVAPAPPQTPQDALAAVRALVQAEQLLDGQLGAAVAAARAAGVDGHALAHALGVHRATLYRRFPVGDDAS